MMGHEKNVNFEPFRVKMGRVVDPSIAYLPIHFMVLAKSNYQHISEHNLVVNAIALCA